MRVRSVVLPETEGPVRMTIRRGRLECSRRDLDCAASPEVR